MKDDNCSSAANELQSEQIDTVKSVDEDVSERSGRLDFILLPQIS